MSGERVFFDTNMLVYLYSKDEPQKQKRALSALLSNECVVSGQVINEFCSVCIRKKKLTPGQLKNIVGNVRDIFELYPIEGETVVHALTVHERYKYSYYDSLIIASAIEAECDYLFTEDMRDGQMIDGVTIRNIFGREIAGG
jgi:predicted nucleic acid-binding protein